MNKSVPFRNSSKTPVRLRQAARLPPSRVIVRESGAQTRRRLLAGAANVFAQRGYVCATSKEICWLAGANMAAVNYHFGGKDGLYAAVLEEAHARLVAMEAVAEIAQSGASAPEKLRLLLRKLFDEIARRDKNAWELRVLGHELMTPTPLMSVMMRNRALPRARMLMGMIADMLDVPPEHPAVSRSAMSVFGPCIFLLVVSPDWQKKMFPAPLGDTNELVDQMVSFTLAGLQAIASELHNR